MNLLDDFRESWSAYRSFGDARSDRLVARALDRARHTIRDRTRAVRGSGFRRAVEGDLWTATREVHTSMKAPQSIPRLRLSMLDTLEALAKVDVLLIASPSPFLGVSGELTPYIDYIGRVDRDFCNYFWRAPPWPRTFDDFVAEGLRKRCRLSLRAAFLMDLRSGLEGMGPDPARDWPLPFYIAMCIQSEMSYRRWITAPAFTFDAVDLEMIEAANRLRIDVAARAPEFRLRSGRSWRDRVRWSVNLKLADRRWDLGDGVSRSKLEKGFNFPFFLPPDLS